jgi:hypothetical protein
LVIKLKHAKVQSTFVLIIMYEYNYKVNKF